MGRGRIMRSDWTGSPATAPPGGVGLEVGAVTCSTRSATGQGRAGPVAARAALQGGQGASGYGSIERRLGGAEFGFGMRDPLPGRAARD